jgi:hypothetical protein
VKTSRAYGIDLLSEPSVREPLERARDNDQLSVVPDVLLLSREKNVQGFLFSLPLYRRGLLKGLLRTDGVISSALHMSAPTMRRAATRR